MRWWPIVLATKSWTFLSVDLIAYRYADEVAHNNRVPANGSPATYLTCRYTCSMSHRRPQETIDITERAEQFLGLADVTREDAWRLLQRFDSDGERANAAFWKRAIGIVTIWGLAIAVSSDFVSEGAFGAFKIRQLSIFVALAPFLVAILYHDIAAMLVVSTLQGRVARKCWRKIFPSSTREQIEAVTISANGMELEGLIIREALGVPVPLLIWLTAGLIYIGIIFGPFAVFVHIAYLAFITTHVYVGLRITLLVIASVITLRALLIAVLSFRVTERAP
jgi:hypothetical protein